MTPDSFARRYGYQEDEIVFEKPDCLPDHIRKRAGLMIVGIFVKQYQGQEEFVEIVKRVLPRSHGLWRWLDTIPAPIPYYDDTHRKYDYSGVLNHLVFPLQDCDWRLFYTVVECVCTEWRTAGTQIEESFASDFNYLLRSYGIPWALQGGWVIPVVDSEFTEDLEYVRQVDQVPNADIATNPLVSLKNAFDALYRKQGGPDITGACNHAWGAWETAREAAGRVNKVKTNYPELWQAMTAWKDRIHAGRHPGKKLGRLPTESETRFIVMLCVNAVRLLSPPLDSDDAA